MRQIDQFLPSFFRWAVFHIVQLFYAVPLVGFIIYHLVTINSLQNQIPTLHHSHNIQVQPQNAIIYRIIGNDLPPRHNPRQSATNLEFILSNEPDFPNVEKVWILNRITDPIKERLLIQLLNSHKKRFIRIPYSQETFEQARFQFTHLPAPDPFYSHEYLTWPTYTQNAAIDEMYHLKNLYVMNNNGARNAALEDSNIQYAQTKRHRWILPFDGNCYFTQSSWDELYGCLENVEDHIKYVIVPMVPLGVVSSDSKVRLTRNNTEVLHKDFKPYEHEEPQVMFRYDAGEMFDENKRYGRRSKVELLWRLRVLGEFENFSFHPWEKYPTKFSSEAGQFVKCGWVTRLFSGQPKQEVVGASKVRALNRTIAIRRHIDDLDDVFVKKRFSHDATLTWDGGRMEVRKHLFWIGQEWEVNLVEGLQWKLSNASLDVIERIIHLTFLHEFTGEERYSSSIQNLLAWKFKFSLKQLSRQSNPQLIARGKEISTLLDCLRLLRKSKLLDRISYIEHQVRFAKLHRKLKDLTDTHEMSISSRNTYDQLMISLAAFTDDRIDVWHRLEKLHLRAPLVIERVNELMDVKNQRSLSEVETIESYIDLLFVHCNSKLLVDRHIDEYRPFLDSVSKLKNMFEVLLSTRYTALKPKTRMIIFHFVSNTDKTLKCFNMTTVHETAHTEKMNASSFSNPIGFLTQ